MGFDFDSEMVVTDWQLRSLPEGETLPPKWWGVNGCQSYCWVISSYHSFPCSILHSKSYCWVVLSTMLRRLSCSWCGFIRHAVIIISFLPEGVSTRDTIPCQSPSSKSFPIESRSMQESRPLKRFVIYRYMDLLISWITCVVLKWVDRSHQWMYRDGQLCCCGYCYGYPRALVAGSVPRAMIPLSCLYS